MMFCVWGNGKLGKMLIELMGKRRISSIIENDESLQHTSYKGIPIVDFNTYKDRYIEYPIIVSPRYSEEEIIDFLHKNNIMWAFPLSHSELSLLGFLKQAPLTKLMKNYPLNEIVYVYGVSILGIVIYDYLIEKGYKCNMIMQGNVGKKLKEYILNSSEIDVEDVRNVKARHRILLSIKLESCDKESLKEKAATMEEYYNLNAKKIYYNKKIEKFRNCHKGGRCFIVATGPSLKIDDLDLLYRSHAVCISMNGIFKIFDRTKWRPDYYAISDLNGARIWMQDILKMNVKGKFIADVAWSFEDDDVQDNMYKWHLHFEWENGKKPNFSENFAEKSYWGRTITYEGGLQLAVYMGFSEIYLLGVDCENHRDLQKQHFVSNYADEASSLQVADNILAYQAAREYAEAHSIKIYNATRGGKLEVFERVDFDSLFE